MATRGSFSFARHLNELLIDRLLLVQHMILQLQIITVAEDFAKLAGGVLSGFDIAIHQVMRHFRAQTRRQADQAFVVGLQQFAVNARLVVHAFQRGQRRQLE